MRIRVAVDPLEPFPDLGQRLLEHVVRFVRVAHDPAHDGHHPLFYRRDQSGVDLFGGIHWRGSRPFSA